MIEADHVSVASDDFDNLSVFDYVDNYGYLASAVPVSDDFLSGYPVSALAQLIHDDNNDSTDSDVNRKRKAMNMDEHHVLPYKLQRPRILKGDFRRHLATLWANVFNSSDHDLMMQFLNAYYEPAVDLWQKDIRGVRMQDSHKLPHIVRHMQGVDILARFWYEAMTAAPDLVCTQKHTCVKIRTDGTSLIQCCFTLTGTKVIPVPDPNDETAMRKLAYYESLIALDRAKISSDEAAMAAVAPEQAAAILYAQRMALLEQSGNITVSAAQLVPVEAAVGAAVAVATSVTAEDTAEAGSEGMVASTADMCLLDRFVVADATCTLSEASASTGTAEAVLATASACEPRSIPNYSGSCSSSCVTSTNTSVGSSVSGCSSWAATDHEHSMANAVTLPTATTAVATVGRISTRPQSGGRPRQAPTESDTCQGEEHALRRYLRAAALVKERRKAKRRKDKTVADEWLSIAKQAFRKTDAVAVAELVGGDGYKYSGSSSNGGSGVLGDMSDTVPRCLALAGGIDCVCSIDMHLSAENKVVSLVLHYIT